MNIAVIGAGAIGGLIAGYLKSAGQDIVLVGHPDSVNAIREKGLLISGVRKNLNIRIDVSEKLNDKPNLAIMATKTQDVDRAIKDNLGFIKNSYVLTAQNGIQADNITAKYIAQKNIISSIIMFGATCLEPGKIVHNFEGQWILGNIFGKVTHAVVAIKESLNKVFSVIIDDNIRGMKYLKIFVNANNCIPAILGKSMQETFRDSEISRISIAIWQEGLNIIGKAGINLVSLPDFPLERLTQLTSMPINEATKIFSSTMTNLSKEPLYGSILQSIKRRRPSEIDYINGEFTTLAIKSGVSAPLNSKLSEMVHQVEETNRFFSEHELISQTKQFIN